MDVTTPAQAVDPLVGQLLSDRYRIEALLGEGGMGRVYRAEHTLMRKRLAIKVLRGELSHVDEIVERFQREAMAAAHIEHPNVVAATDFGKTPDGSLFLVMEFVEGTTLTEALAAGHFSISRAVHVTAQILRALTRAHALGIVHRDLKPDNVHLVERDGDPDFVKVLDFGIAKVSIGETGTGKTGQPLTQVGLVYGTPEYMAPEQALGQPVDVRADLYSVGVMLYEMLAGRLPFVAEDKVQLLGMHIGIEPRPISEVAPDAEVPHALDGFVLSMLAKARDHRPEDAATALDLLAIAAEGVIVEESAAPLRRDAPQSVRTASGRKAPTPTPSTKLSQTFVRAATQLVPVVAEGIVKAEGRLARLKTQVGLAYKKDPKRGRIVAGAVAGAIVVAGFLLVISGGEEPIDVPAREGVPVVVPPTVARQVERDLSAFKEMPEVKAALAKLSQGQAEGAIADLEAIRGRDREDARVAYLLGTIYADQQRWRLSMERYGAALAVDERMRADETLRQDVVAALSEREASEAAIQILATRVGDAAIDELVTLAVDGPTRSGRSNARKALVRMGTMEHLPPWAQKVLALADASRCEEKRALIVEIGAIGDERARAALERLPRRGSARGCGFLGMEACAAPCYVAELDEAIRRLGGTP